LSVAADALDETGRARIVDFYFTVFGWEELPTMTLDRERLVMMAHRYDQFVFLIADEHPMTTARLDHFGQSVESRAEMDAIRDRVVKYREEHPEYADDIDLVDSQVEEYPGLRLHAFYVGYLLPLMVETQYWEWSSDQG
jgi:hypothetical protein